MPVNPFDKASRFAAKLDAHAFLCWLLGPPPEALVFRKWLDTRGLPFPGDPDWQAKLEGWNVEESTVVNEWIAIGEKRGEARGRNEGRAEGRTEGQQTSLLGMLVRKYGTVPEDVVAVVRGTTDADRLQDLLWLVATAPDLAAFRQQAGV